MLRAATLDSPPGAPLNAPQSIRTNRPRGRSSVGRARRSQCRGQGFDSPRLHQSSLAQRGKTARHSPKGDDGPLHPRAKAGKPSTFASRARQDARRSFSEGGLATDAAVVCCPSSCPHPAYALRNAVRTMRRMPVSKSTTLSNLNSSPFEAMARRKESSVASAGSDVKPASTRNSATAR